MYGERPAVDPNQLHCQSVDTSLAAGAAARPCEGSRRSPPLTDWIKQTTQILTAPGSRLLGAFVVDHGIDGGQKVVLGGSSKVSRPYCVMDHRQS
jgi:hypothetical protein